MIIDKIKSILLTPLIVVIVLLIGLKLMFFEEKCCVCNPNSSYNLYCIKHVWERIV